MALPSSFKSARVSCGRRVKVTGLTSGGSGVVAFCCAEAAPVSSKPASAHAMVF
jgi:hypothetical protein